MMGNLIKINMYAEIKKEEKNKLKVETLEKNILEYNNWLKKTKREDKMENYESFLQVQ